ncbi:histidine kinase [Nakamurella leprariae]|uniref:histidine kinase n=1 Tax=Nakamurella leprariae TaxID=2803911 RepID=A0A938YGY5_9ACTN|nr:histidine kinase [Nakamurella leprariae]MBM9467615.1 hypothetical protein [Nakamurella leprariae]
MTSALAARLRAGGRSVAGSAPGSRRDGSPVLLPGRLAWLRLIAVPLLIGIPHLVQGETLALDWCLISVGSGLLFLSAGWWPTTAALLQVSLLLVAQSADLDLGAFKVMAGIAVFEVAYTRPLRVAAVPAALLAGGTVVSLLQPPAHEAGLVFYKLALMVAAPLLLGAYLHAQFLQTRERHAAEVQAQLRRGAAEREAAAQTRTAIARELHDVVAHHVASIALRSAVARDVLPLEEAARRALGEINDAATVTLTEMRRLVTLLRVPAGDRSGPDAVEMLDPELLAGELDDVADRVRSAGLPVTLTAPPGHDPVLAQLDAGQALAVLRVVQEGLTNVLRHAPADATAAVGITRTPVDDGARGEVLVVSVVDRSVAGRRTRPATVSAADAALTDAAGTGPAADDEAVPGRGFGLLGLRERLELLGGAVTAGPTADGWRLVASIPLGTAAESTAGSTAGSTPSSAVPAAGPVLGTAPGPSGPRPSDPGAADRRPTDPVRDDDDNDDDDDDDDAQCGRRRRQSAGSRTQAQR